MPRIWARLAVVVGALLIALTAAVPLAVATGPKPPDPIPTSLQGANVGINTKTGEYCDLDDPNKKIRDLCRQPGDCELPGTVCVGEGSSDPAESHTYDENMLTKWQATTDHNAGNYAKLNKFLTNCIEVKHRGWQDCYNQGSATYPPPAPGPISWAEGQISAMASNALKEIAEALGHSVVWLLQQFASSFNSISTIKLKTTGIGPIMGITTGISALVATFLLLVQFGKLAVSQQGGPLVTAITGLAKWAAILAVYFAATQTALDWSDTLSTALINATFQGGGSGPGDASAAMQQQLGTLFSGLVGGGGGAAAGSALITGSGIAASAVGFVIIISILVIVAIGALWMEMLIRQAGIMVLVVAMPLAVAGQMADVSKEWWPKARNALIALILMKPVIVLIFAIGFDAMSGGSGVRNILVGLIIFVLAAFAWPVLASFLTFTTIGAGAAMASGVMGSIGSSISSMFGGNQPTLAGAGAVGGGSGYTKALEADTTGAGAAGAAAGGGGGATGASGSAGDGSGSGGSGGKGFWSSAMGGRNGGGFWSQVGGTVGMGLQLAAVGKDMAESGAANAAAHAEVGQQSPGGRHAVVPRRTAGGGAPASREETTPRQAAPSGGGAGEAEPVPPPPAPAVPPPDGPEEG